MSNTDSYIVDFYVFHKSIIYLYRTDTDHTCYTVETGGSEGFLSLLPVYLDHILYPTITDSAFQTEVHHIDGDGKNSISIELNLIIMAFSLFH